MRILILTLVLAGYSFAGPVLSPDGVAVDPSDPGLGRLIIGIPGSTWEAWLNDNWGNTAPGDNGDYDFNDLFVRILFGSSGIGEIVGWSAADLNVVTIGGITLSRNDTGPKTFTYVPGAELIISAMDMSTGKGPYYSGPASRNADGAIHWYTEQTVTPTPEPASMLLIGGGLVGLGFLRKKRK